MLGIYDQNLKVLTKFDKDSNKTNRSICSLHNVILSTRINMPTQSRMSIIKNVNNSIYLQSGIQWRRGVSQLLTYGISIMWQ